MGTSSPDTFRLGDEVELVELVEPVDFLKTGLSLVLRRPGLTGDENRGGEELDDTEDMEEEGEEREESLLGRGTGRLPLLLVLRS